MEILPYCDEFKFGLLSGTSGKTAMYDDSNALRQEIAAFFKFYNTLLKDFEKKVYWKKSIISLLLDELVDSFPQSQ